MSRPIVYVSETGEDFVEALNYYQAISPRLGAAFERAFHRAEDEVEKGMVTHKTVFDDYHRVLLRRFPYILYYRLSGAQAVIVGLLYARMAPENIEAALKSRSA